MSAKSTSTEDTRKKVKRRLICIVGAPGTNKSEIAQLLSQSQHLNPEMVRVLSTDSLVQNQSRKDDNFRNRFYKTMKEHDLLPSGVVIELISPHIKANDTRSVVLVGYPLLPDQLCDLENHYGKWGFDDGSVHFVSLHTNPNLQAIRIGLHDTDSDRREDISSRAKSVNRVIKEAHRTNTGSDKIFHVDSSGDPRKVCDDLVAIISAVTGTPCMWDRERVREKTAA